LIEQRLNITNVNKKEPFLKHFLKKYRVQIYFGIAAISAVTISFLVGYAFRTLKQKKSVEFSSLSHPRFESSLVNITQYNFGDISLNFGNVPVYRYETNVIGMIDGAAKRLGINSPIKEDKYNEIYYWKDDKQELSFSSITGRVYYKGDSNLVWLSEADIKKGLMEIFSINTANLELLFYYPGKNSSWWTFYFKFNGKKVFCEGDDRAVSIFTDGSGKVVEISLFYIDTVGSVRVPLLPASYIKENIDKLPKFVKTVIYSDVECKDEFCYRDPSSFTGSFEVKSAEISYYKEQMDRPFLIPVLSLYGDIVTEKGSREEGVVLVDIIDWKSYGTGS